MISLHPSRIFVAVLFTTSLATLSLFAASPLSKGLVQTAGTTTVPPVKITLLPTDNGAYRLDWKVFPSGDWYQAVDEQYCNGLTDYVSSVSTNAVYNRESFKVSLDKIPNGSLISALSINPCLGTVYTGKVSMANVFYRLNGVNGVYRGGYNVTSTQPRPYSPARFTWALPFVKTTSTALEIGVQNTGGTGGVRLSQINVEVEYNR